MLLLLRQNIDTVSVTASSNGQGMLFLTHLLQAEAISIPIVQNSGGWDIYAYHKRKRLREVEEQRLEEIAVKRLEVERLETEIKSEQEQARKTEQNRKIFRLQKDIDLKIKQVQDLQERIDALLTLIYLEREQLLLEQSQRRRKAMTLLLLAA